MKMYKLAVLFLALLAWACAAPKTAMVSSYYNNSTDFGSYRTFGFASGSMTDINSFDDWNDAVFRAQVENSIVYEMQGNGFSIDHNKPDVLIFYRLFKKDSPQPVSVPLPRDYDVGTNVNRSENNSTMINIEKGTLMVQLYDTKTNRVVWQGMMPGVGDGKPLTDRMKIQKAIAGIFNEYTAQTGVAASR